jgi:hypothetical protein
MEFEAMAGFVELINTGQAAIRGLALLAFVDEAEAERAWPVTRRHLTLLRPELFSNAEPSR